VDTFLEEVSVSILPERYKKRVFLERIGQKKLKKGNLKGHFSYDGNT